MCLRQCLARDHNAQTMTDLEARIQSAPLADTHEHLQSPGALAERQPDILQMLFDGGYITADLNVAGARRKDVERLVNSADRDIAGRFAAVQDAWQRCQHTGYGEGLRLAAERLWGLTELTPESLAEADAQTAPLREPSAHERLLREVAGLTSVHLDYGDWPLPEWADGKFYRHDLSWYAMSCGRIDVAAILAATGVEVRSLASLAEAQAALFERHGPQSVGVKTQHAYERTLAWQPRTDAEVAPLVHAIVAGRELRDVEKVVLGDWCLARGVELATQRRLPVKIHTGYNAGDSYMQLDRVRPAHLSPLLAAYPDARFVLFHTGYPYGGEVRALAKHYPNVYLDFCWAWSIDPPGTAAFLRQVLHTIPTNKVFVFGGDACWPAQTVGYAAQCRKWLTRALAAEVAAGDLTERQAIAVAGMLMSGNQVGCFDV